MDLLIWLLVSNPKGLLILLAVLATYFVVTSLIYRVVVGHWPGNP